MLKFSQPYPFWLLTSLFYQLYKPHDSSLLLTPSSLSVSSSFTLPLHLSLYRSIRTVINFLAMASASKHSSLLLFFILCALLFPASLASSRRLAALVEKQPLTLTYHKGALLSGLISVNLIWYGKFTPSQRSVVSDFVSSLSTGGDLKPSVFSWWAMAERYYTQSKVPLPQLTLGDNILDEACSLGKSLKNAEIYELASRGRRRRAINVVLTADDVAVEGFCMSRCATHGSSPRSRLGRFAYIWVGNSAAQCPGQCAWPFHKPVYGPQTPPLVAPNADVGVDGIVMNLASMIAGTATNPFGGGFFMGPMTAPLEAATACPGVYGRGAYPGYAGELLVDTTTGASYNSNGAHGRKYVLPAIFDPTTASCSTLV